MFDLKLLKERIWDSKTESFKIIEDYLPFYEALRKDPPKYPEWSGVFKKEGESRKVFQAFSSLEKLARQKLVNQIKKKYNYTEPDLLEICLAVSWHKSRDKTGGNAKLASIMTNKAKIRYRGTAPYKCPTEWHRANSSAFKQHLQRLRNKAKAHEFYEAVPPDYWKKYA
ncbi:MAG: hypothetical protein O7B35_13610 [Deltaproteobacteria bacterium]|nr:hypothetical protein [Deltaproteobacteria bacterium]